MTTSLDALPIVFRAWTKCQHLKLVFYLQVIRGEMKLIGALGTLAFNVILLLALPSLIIALWGIVFLVGVLSTVFDFKSMK